MGTRATIDFVAKAGSNDSTAYQWCFHQRSAQQVQSRSLADLLAVSSSERKLIGDDHMVGQNTLPKSLHAQQPATLVTFATDSHERTATSLSNSRSNGCASGYVTAAWVKRRYSIANSTLYLWIASKRLPAPVKIGSRAIRFRLDDILAFEAGLGRTIESNQTSTSNLNRPAPIPPIAPVNQAHSQGREQ